MAKRHSAKSRALLRQLNASRHQARVISPATTAAANNPPTVAPITADYLPAAYASAAAMAGGRLTTDLETQYLGTTQVILPPPDAESDWRILNLDVPGRLWLHFLD